MLLTLWSSELGCGVWGMGWGGVVGCGVWWGVGWGPEALGLGREVLWLQFKGLHLMSATVRTQPNPIPMQPQPQPHQVAPAVRAQRPGGVGGPAHPPRV